MKRILYTRPDGGLSVIIPGRRSRLPDEPEGQWLDRLALGAVAAFAPRDPAHTPAQHAAAAWAWAGTQVWRVVEAAAISADRHFRDCWEDVPGVGVRVNLTKARAQRRAELLALRPGKLAEVREQIEAAEDAGAAVVLAALKAKRRRLREIEAKLDADLPGLATPEALRAYLPADLA